MAALKLKDNIIKRILSPFGENGEKRGECLVVHGLAGTSGHHWEVSVSLNSLFEDKKFKDIFNLTKPSFSGYYGKVLLEQKPVGWDTDVSENNFRTGFSPTLTTQGPNVFVTNFVRDVLVYYVGLAKTWNPTEEGSTPSVQKPKVVHKVKDLSTVGKPLSVIKADALKDPAVKAEYDALTPEFSAYRERLVSLAPDGKGGLVANFETVK